MKKSLIALAAMAAAGCATAVSRSRNYDDLASGHELRAFNAGGLEASLKAQMANARNAMSPGDGRAVVIHDKAVLGAGQLGTPIAADTIDFFVPAGTKVSDLSFVLDDCDSGVAFTFSVGYRPVSSIDGPLAANAAYFAAAGQTVGQAGGRLECAFKPITFQQDVFIALTVGVAPTVVGNPEIHMVAIGSSEGVK